MSPVWENYRDELGYLDIGAALLDAVRSRSYDSRRVRAALDFIDSVEELCPLSQPAAAQIVFIRAMQIAN